MTKPIIFVKICYKLLYVIQGVENSFDKVTSWPQLISEILSHMPVCNVAFDWPHTFLHPRCFCLASNLQITAKIPTCQSSHETHSMRLKAVPLSLAHLPHKNPTKLSNGFVAIYVSEEEYIFIHSLYSYRAIYTIQH